MDNITLNMEQRENIGGGRPRKLRREGFIPGVVYGKDMNAVATKIDASALRFFISKNGRNSVFTTEFAAEHDFSALIKDIQYDPVTKNILHVDFQKVSLSEEIQAEVPVRVKGAGAIEREGGIVQHQLNEVTIECLPQNVPKYIEADITGMTPGHNITAANLKIPEGVTLVTEPREVILSITNSKLDLAVEKVDEPVIPAGKEGVISTEEV